MKNKHSTSKIVINLLKRDLIVLKNELISYTNEQDIWKVNTEINNSAGNLCLHILGNLNTYIGAVIGQTDYVRDRDLEFSMQNVLRVDLLDKVEQTIIIVENSLKNVSDDLLKTNYPQIVFNDESSIEYVLIHLTTHLAYHLGQINYHRKLLNNE